MSVGPAGPIVRIDVVRLGFASYKLLGYTSDGVCGWEFVEPNHWTRDGATRAARRYLRASRGSVVNSVA